MERGAQIGVKCLIAFRGRVRTNTTEVSTGCLFQESSNFTGRVALQMHSSEWASGIIS